MWYPPVTTAAPEGDVIALDDAKTYLRVDGDAEDSVVTGALASAIAHVEAYTATRLLTQTVTLRCGSFDDFDHLPIGPVQSIGQIEYLDASGVQQTLNASQYELFGAGLERGIRTAVQVRWPTIRQVQDGIAVTLTVGYGDAADIPAPVLRAVLLLLGDFYENREDTIAERSVTPTTLPNGVDTNLVNFRINA